MQAANPQTQAFQESLARLCSGYWQPVFAFIRAKGFGADQARDYTQDFFASIIEKRSLSGVDREKGRFRHFIMAAVGHFLSNRLDAERTLKRGGGQIIVSLEDRHSGGDYRHEPIQPGTPETVFECNWAVTLLERALARTRAEYPEPSFSRLKPFLVGEADRGQISITAREMALSEGALKVAVHRLRRKYRDALRAEIADTLARPEEVEDEIRYLLAVLSRGGPTRHGWDRVPEV